MQKFCSRFSFKKISSSSYKVNKEGKVGKYLQRKSLKKYELRKIDVVWKWMWCVGKVARYAICLNLRGHMVYNRCEMGSSSWKFELGTVSTKIVLRVVKLNMYSLFCWTFKSIMAAFLAGKIEQKSVSCMTFQIKIQLLFVRFFKARNLAILHVIV